EGGEGGAGLDGGEAKDALHVQGEQEELRERTRSNNSHRPVRRRGRAQAEDPQREKRCPRAELNRDEGEQEGNRGREHGERRGSAPAVARAAGERVDEQREAGGDRGCAGKVEMAMRQ